MVAVLAVMPVFSVDLLSQLPLLAPRAVAWARSLESDAMRMGRPLAPRVVALARAAGVQDPRRVRIVVVDRMPLPDEPLLRAAAQQVGLADSNVTGLTIGHAIFVKRGRERDPRLLSHELRHVAQYEQAGGIAGFLAKHLVDLAMNGYEDSPYEVDARAHEKGSFPNAGA
jgi:hypothetical protein